VRLRLSCWFSAATALGLLWASVCAASIFAATALRAVLAAIMITIIAAIVDLNFEIQPWIETGKHKAK
jgi:hypothetical protein